MSVAGFAYDEEIAPLKRGLLPIQRVPGRTYTHESADLSTQRKVTIGEGYILADVHPGDLRGPLREWLAGGGSTHVEYRPDLQESEGAVPVSIYVDDADVTRDPSWHERMTRIRIVPRDGVKMQYLLEALALRDLGGGSES